MTKLPSEIIQGKAKALYDEVLHHGAPVEVTFLPSGAAEPIRDTIMNAARIAALVMEHVGAKAPVREFELRARSDQNQVTLRARRVPQVDPPLRSMEVVLDDHVTPFEPPSGGGPPGIGGG